MYHVLENWWKSSFSKNSQKRVFCTYVLYQCIIIIISIIIISFNIFYKIHFFFGENILVALDTYLKNWTHP